VPARLLINLSRQVRKEILPAMTNASRPVSFPYDDEFLDLYFLFARARYLTFRAREKELRRYDLTPEQAQVLFTVQALDNQGTPAEISRRLVRQPHTISTLVNRMAKKGLVRKVKDLERKNMVRVVLTDMGREACDLSIKGGPIRRILGTLDESERRQFQQYLERIMTRAREELGLDRDDLPPSD
jgi:MarR family transcriptional regulator, organic hydroperoxide resistance regulator